MQFNKLALTAVLVIVTSASAWEAQVEEYVALATTPTPAPTESATSTSAPVSYMPLVNITKQFAPKKGHSTLRIEPAIEGYTPGESPTGGDFRIHCAQSHQSNDDPIVFSGQEGAAHHHTFFGNTSTNYASTSDSLKTSGNSTCHGGLANRSAYWLPSLIDTNDGTPLEPDWALFYYKGGKVKPPNGLKIIAGEQTATNDNSQNRNKINWQCNAGELGGAAWENRTNHIPDCVGDLTATVHFPNCWDGENLDSPSHKSHVVYESNLNLCPASHPKQISNISGIIHYAVNGTSHLRLSSDNYEGDRGGYSLHMDYMFAWDDDVLDTWWENCQVPDKDCHADLLGNGEMLY